MLTAEASIPTVFAPGTRVQVRNRYVGSWSRGFEIAASTPDGLYLVRRISDRSLLPAPFRHDEVVAER